MIEEGVVQTIGTTDKGTPKIEIAGKNYFAGRGVDVDMIKVGDKIIVEYEFFGDRKNVRGLKSWSMSPNILKTPQTNGPTGSLNEPVNVMTKDESIFVCGVVNNALMSGRIQAPQDLSTWVHAAVHAYREFDDKIPI